MFWLRSVPVMSHVVVTFFSSIVVYYLMRIFELCQYGIRWAIYSVSKITCGFWFELYKPTSTSGLTPFPTRISVFGKSQYLELEASLSCCQDPSFSQISVHIHTQYLFKTRLILFSCLNLCLQSCFSFKIYITYYFEFKPPSPQF